MTALLITPEADFVQLDLPADSKIQQAVKRAVMRCDRYDVVALTNTLDMWIDDEGLYNHPVNKVATAFAARFGFIWQNYHGPVLLTGGADVDGGTVPLTKDQVLAFLATLGEG
ncbi:DUF3846 domain-containing protein [Streptomyces kronopolitis]|nr:DUF3846 domain-containing protein [Streptomyces kronopolitis]